MKKILLFNLLFLLCIFSYATPTFAEISRYPNNLGLVGYWSFNEGTSTIAGDFSGKGNMGTLTNMENTDWVSGSRGKALNFDGVDEKVDVGSGSSLDDLGASTACAWIYPRGWGEGNFGRIYEKGLAGVGYVFFLDNDGTAPDQTIRLVVAYTTTSLSRSGAANLISLNTWQHVCVTWDGGAASSGVLLYVNGVVSSSYGEESNAVDARTSDAANSGFIGDRSDELRSFDGKIDEVRVYNRVLSSSEILTLYKSGAVQINSPQNIRLTSGLIAHWSLDGASITENSILDVSGRGNPAGFVGAATSSAKIPGKIGQGFLFNGVNTYIRARDTNDAFDVENITASVWINKKLRNQASWTSLFTRQTGTGSGDAFAIYYDSGSSDTYSWAVTTAGGQDSITGGASTGDVNTWVNIIGTYDGTTMRIYRNGVLAGSKVHTFGGALVSDTTSVTLGGGFNGVGADTGVSEFANVALDEARLYNRALSPDEILQLYRLGGSTFNAPTNNRSTSGLIGYWTFNGPDITANDVTDVTGNGSRGGFIGGATSTAKVPGKIGQALRFDGQNDYVRLGDPTPTILRPTKITLAGWIKVLGPATGDEAENGSDIINSVRTASPWWSWGIGADGHAGTLDYQEFTFHITTAGGRTALTATTSTSYLNEWRHVVGTYDGVNMKVYVNGVLSTSTPKTGDITYTNVKTATIGSWDSGDNNANALIDEVRVYNRALTATEVNQLYRMGGLTR